MKQKKIIASEKKSLEKECHRRAYIKVIIAAITILASVFVLDALYR